MPPLETDVRIISASNIDLKGMCDNNEFRKDLFYRLNVFPIQLPSLRERKEDIPLLVEVLLRRLNKKFQKNLLDVHPHVITAFEHYPWPGNIRELENLIERAHILESSPVLTPDSFPQELFDNLGPADELSGETLPTLTQWRRTALDALEKRYLADVLSRNGGSIKASAESAGIGTRQLHQAHETARAAEGRLQGRGNGVVDPVVAGGRLRRAGPPVAAHSGGHFVS